MRNETTHRQLKYPRWLTWALWAVALTGLLYLVGLTVWLGVEGLFFPYQLDYGEGTHLHYTRELLAGRPIYRPLGQYPYITSNYAPLPFVLAMILTPFLGVTYAAGRIWTLLAVAAIAAIMVAWLRKETRRWLPGVVAALTFVGAPTIYHWAPLFRVDLVGLALTLGGLYAVYKAFPKSGDAPRPWLSWLAMALFVAALYAKQSYLFAPAAAVAYLFFCVDRRRAIVLAVSIGLLGGGIFLAINALTGGSFWQSMVIANVNVFLWPEFWQQQHDFFGTFAALGLLAAWGLVDKFVLDRSLPVHKKVSLLDLYLPAALASVLLAGKAGAWENYFFEALAALVLYAGLGLARMMDRRKGSASRTGPLSIVLPLLVLAQVALMWHTPRVANRYLALTRQSYEEMAPILENTPGPVFSEDMGLLVTYDKVLDYHSFEYSQLAEAGRWDQSWELGELRSRNRSLVILEEGTRLNVDRYRRFTRAFLSELDRNYRHNRTVGKYELYEPDPLQHERRAEFGDQLAVVGWSLHAPQPVQAGDVISLTVVWQAQQKLATDYTAFAHIADESGQGWAGDDHQPYAGLYPTSAWGAGEMVRDTFSLALPADAPPGLYDVQVGWYDPATQQRLPAGEGDSVRVAVLPVGHDAGRTPAVTPVNAQFGGALALEGYARQLEPGGLRVTLRWSAGDYLDTEYTIFVHLVDPDDETQVLAQDDGPPLDGRWPTSLWLPGVVLDDEHIIPLPPDLSAGTYRLLVGLYDPHTGVRLSLAGGGDAVRLFEIDLP